MVFSYEDCIQKYGSDYQIKKAVSCKKLYKIEKGVYSDKQYPSELSVITLKYPKAVFTMESAFYYHDLTDVIPEEYFLLTSKHSSKIRDTRIKQIYDSCSSLDMGKTVIDINGAQINIYNKERMLVELLRNKNKLPFDYYKEIILNYRKIINTIDIALVMDYIYALPKAEFVSDALQLKSCNIVNHVHTANTEALTKGVKYMINIAEMIQAENKNGYVQTDQASAKVAQDLILVAISGSSVNKNIAIKGGVVMMNKTQNVRRATRDIDLSFIHYSLSDESINDFVSQLHIPGIKFQRVGKIEELHQQDYHGKRIYVLITDMFGNSLKTKMDIGVHNRLNIEQDECSFNAVIDNQRQEFKILVNSNEQIFAEKLRSLIKFKTVSTRFKDIADLYYLSDKVNTAKLRECVDTYILSDTELPQYNNVDDILKVLNVIASNKKYKKRVISSKQLWIDDDIDEMFSVIIHTLEKI